MNQRPLGQDATTLATQPTSLKSKSIRFFCLQSVFFFSFRPILFQVRCNETKPWNENADELKEPSFLFFSFPAAWLILMRWQLIKEEKDNVEQKLLTIHCESEKYVAQ